jgi:hypothetical protein
MQEDGNIAWGDCQFTAMFTPQGSKEKMAFISQGTFTLRKRDGEWRITLEHFSPIANVPRVQRSKN